MNSKSTSIASSEFLRKSASPRRLDKLARQMVMQKLESLEYGQITVNEGATSSRFGAVSGEFPHEVHIDVHAPDFFSDVAFGGSIGAGESYIQGAWSCTDLVALIRILLRNRDVLDDMDSGAAVLKNPLRKAAHWFNRNTRSGSQRNISAHYDLGNDFYALWLDPEMMYSSAFYPSADATLDEAAVAKLDRICKKLRLQPDDHVIEIGTGWGGFAVHAAKHFGCKVTTTTISQRQYEWAQARIVVESLEDRITLLQSDYRDLDGKFDKLVSIEMIEAVGHEYLETFFQKCASLLKPDGELLIQAITIADQRYEQAKNTVDFIKRYIFPGGFLPSVTAMSSAMTRKTDLRMIHLEDIGLHYARTLHEWRQRFFEKLDDVRGMGFSEEFIRMWDFYLTYCEGAFEERAIGNVQLHAIKPLARPSV